MSYYLFKEFADTSGYIPCHTTADTCRPGASLHSGVVDRTVVIARTTCLYDPACHSGDCKVPYDADYHE